MQTVQPNRTFNSRDALKLAGIAGVTALGGYALYEYAPWSNYEAVATQFRQAFHSSELLPAPLLELVRFASLARGDAGLTALNCLRASCQSSSPAVTLEVNS